MIIRLIFSFVALTAILWGILELGKFITWSPTLVKKLLLTISCAGVASILLLVFVELF